MKRASIEEAHAAYNAGAYEEAFQRYAALAKEGDPDAQTSLAYMYQMGQGCRRDEAKALSLYQKAIEHKQPYALFNLAIWYANGKGGVERNPFKAFELFLQAAIAGIPQAQYETAVMLERGLGCTQDYAEAAHWYEEAAKRGHAEAFNNLGVLYKEGTGVAQDYGRAFICFSRAAEQNLATAQFNLGYLYDHGLGVEMDHEKALELCRKAAFQGHPKAKEVIRKLQEEGKIAF